MIKLIDDKDCTGCSACSEICPNNCINMEQGIDGFIYPTISSNCLNCKLCEKVCPVINQKEIINIEQTAAALRTKNKKVWLESTSGGAFYEICDIFFKRNNNKNSYIYAARFDHLDVVHDHFENINEIKLYQKSKYVQSNITHIYKEIKEKLNQQFHILFIGTPCQVAGLRNFLIKDYENLLCVDFICHGVGSPGVFKAFINYIEKIYNKKIMKYTFRTKKDNFFSSYEKFTSKITFYNNQEKYLSIDSYNQLFTSQLIIRQSCNENCRFRTTNRQGDITIADFNNKSIVLPKLWDEKNYSSVIFNSQKSLFYKNELKKNTIYFECDIKDIKINNPLFYRSATANNLRNSFFEDFKKGMSYNLLIRKYLKNKKTFLSEIEQKIPYKIKYFLFKITAKCKSFFTCFI